jgi:FkbH-like protein
LAPRALSVSATSIQKVALIGSCFIQSWRFHERNPSNCVADLFVVNNAGLLPELRDESGASAYNFAVIQIPLRSVLKDDALWHFSHDSWDMHEAAYRTACDNLAFQLNSRMQWNVRYGMLSFVANFFVPQRNPMGCLFPRFDLRNPEFFIGKLNEHLENLVSNYQDAFILDVDRIAGSLGRRFIQDDLVEAHSHNSLLGTPGVITSRIEPMDAMSAHFDVRWPTTFPEAIWSEMISMYRTVRQMDSVKLVVVDLDDTLWNGVSGEISAVDPIMVEGWPLGLAEALCYLKKRGILLAIVSKNDDERVRSIWAKIFDGRLDLQDFAAIRINWKPKAENLADIMADMNLLARSVVFIDDNPVERAAIKHAFPEVRVLGRHPYYLRQTLLWSSETQVVCVTEESSSRTEMMKAQLEREADRTEVSREDFPRAAAPAVRMMGIASISHARFSRAFELINKTNQFNTTGRRWTTEECDAFLCRGGVIQAFEVRDTYTAYGLVGVLMVECDMIVQWVMSCRILGYQIEDAVMAAIVRRMRAAGLCEVRGFIIETDVNFPCRDLYAKLGFVKSGDEWVLKADFSVSSPSHVTVEEPEAKIADEAR